MLAGMTVFGGANVDKGVAAVRFRWPILWEKLAGFLGELVVDVGLIGFQGSESLLNGLMTETIDGIGVVEAVVMATMVVATLVFGFIVVAEVVVNIVVVSMSNGASVVVLGTAFSVMLSTLPRCATVVLSMTVLCGGRTFSMVIFLVFTFMLPFVTVNGFSVDVPALTNDFFCVMSASVLVTSKEPLMIFDFDA